MRARDVMAKPVIWITLKAKLGEAISLFQISDRLGAVGMLALRRA